MPILATDPVEREIHCGRYAARHSEIRIVDCRTALKACIGVRMASPMSFLESWNGLGDLFKDEWIVTRRAARLFFVASVCVLCLTPVFLGRVHTARMLFWERFPWGILGVAGPVAFFFLWIAMWRYWSRIDGSKGWIKRASFVVLLFGIWFGAVLYCGFVYFPQVRRNWRAA